MGSQEIIFSLSLSFLLIPNIEKYKKKLSSDEVFIITFFFTRTKYRKTQKNIFIGWCLLCAAIALLLTI